MGGRGQLGVVVAGGRRDRHGGHRAVEVGQVGRGRGRPVGAGRRDPGVGAGGRHAAPVHGAQQAAEDVAGVAGAPPAGALDVVFTCSVEMYIFINVFWCP